MTGLELTTRLLNNIKTSLELRAYIPYLDMLKDLVEGGATFSSAVLNTSSNFGSFDTYLREILELLNGAGGGVISYQILPLPLSSILTNLTANADFITLIFQSEITSGASYGEFQYRLELVNAAAV